MCLDEVGVVVKFTLPKILAIITICVGSVVMAGWFLDIAILKSILPTWVTMKFTTALCFVMGGLLLFSIDRVREPGEKSTTAEILLPISSIIMAFLMGALLFSVIFQVKLGIGDLFVKEAPGAVKTTKPGIPSSGTMVSFLAIAIVGLLQLFEGEDLTIKTIHFLGWIVALAGGLAIVGYVFDVEVLYYTLEGVSTAMAFHTAILFVFLGLGMIAIKHDEEEPISIWPHLDRKAGA